MKARIPNNRPRPDAIPLQLLTPEEMKKLTPEQQAKINAASINLKETMKKLSNNSFVMGAKAISKIAVKEYKLDIDAAENYDTLRAVVDKLFGFLGKGDALK